MMYETTHPTRRLPPGSGIVRSPMQLLAFSKSPYEFFRDNQRRYGDIFRIFLPPAGSVVFVGDPAIVKEVFDKDRAGGLTIRDDGFLGPIFGENSVVVTTAKKHAGQRRMVTPPFHGASMKACGDAIHIATERAIERWCGEGQVHLHRAMIDLTLDATITAVLGIDDRAQVERVRYQLRRTIDACRPELMFIRPLRLDLGLRSPWGRFLHERASFRALMEDELRRRRAERAPGRTDLLSLLLSLQQQAEPLDDQEVHDQLLTMLVLGHESTAAALAWMVHSIDMAPRVQEALYEELASVQPSTPTEMTAKLPYLTAVCKESLRLWPVVPEVRRRVLLEPWSLGGFDLPAGIYLSPCIYLIHRNPSIYPSPDEFRPERFLTGKFASHEFLPFGGGARSCVGAAFALYEMQIIMATVLSRVDLRIVNPGPVRAIRQNLSVAPSGNAQIRVRQRTTRDLYAVKSVA